MNYIVQEALSEAFKKEDFNCIYSIYEEELGSSILLEELFNAHHSFIKKVLVNISTDCHYNQGIIKGFMKEIDNLDKKTLNKYKLKLEIIRYKKFIKRQNLSSDIEKVLELEMYKNYTEFNVSFIFLVSVFNSSLSYEDKVETFYKFIDKLSMNKELLIQIKKEKTFSFSLYFKSTSSFFIKSLIKALNKNDIEKNYILLNAVIDKMTSINFIKEKEELSKYKERLSCS